MKHLFAIVVFAAVAFAGSAAVSQPDLLARIHFAGAQKISAAPNSSAFTNEFCSVEALAIRAQLSSRLAAWLAGWLHTNQNVVVSDGSTRLRPLFDDLQKSEWFFEAKCSAAGKPEFAIAIKISSDRSTVWQNGLRPFFPTGTLRYNNSWFIFESNAGLKLGDALSQRLRSAPEGWLDLDINWPQLSRWNPSFKQLALPETQLVLTAPDNNFRISGKFYFPENLNLKLDPWVVPTNTLHQPFNSFTAARGFAGWLQSQAWAQTFQISPPVNQLFVWSLPTFPFQTYAAAPVPNAADAIAQLRDRLFPAFLSANSREYFMSPVVPEMTTNNQITLTGMPFVAPYIRGVTEPHAQFVFLETFPNTPKSKPLPPELFQRLATKDIVFYHWEITAERLQQLLHVSQFALMVTSHKQLDADSASFKWMQRIGGQLGNTDTEIMQTGPAEFTFARKAPGIFTATELFILANWMEATNFPGCDLRLPRHAPHPKRPRPATPQVISIPATGNH